MRVMAIDPGPTLGICIADEDGVTVTQAVMTLGAVSMWLQGLSRRPDRIIVERFMFYKDERRDYVDYTPGEYNGVIKAYCEVTSTPCIEQNASMAVGKTAFWGDSKEGNNRLRKIGLWDRSNYPHGMDALRHYLYWDCFTRKSSEWLMKLK